MDCSLPGSSVDGVSQQEYYSRDPSQGICPTRSPIHIPALAGRFFTAESPGKPILGLAGELGFLVLNMRADHLWLQVETLQLQVETLRNIIQMEYFGKLMEDIWKQRKH